ncbi:PRC and DUF2382 domain-containing protein [Kitasatospora cheerisanensis]|uniref:Photosystem reaction center subunit H n=1 Tax=Kitasatospora cheerisanensis KCTC 2395 TaxID=1348663 RepID=A0A066YVV3_9ACTN|nr:PRC and DUF2382 domain-containing protein [Kitasatospora cheerisanensis]KDN82186.1 photosystem reaction center subunit H [Kitasatospora cheerisanensis KCTC 2395]
MITERQIRSMLHHPVHDAEGNKIGKADHLFLDDATGRPEWVSIKTGWFGTSESFVPIHDAQVVDDHLQVPFAKSKVKAAPNVDVDRGGHLSEAEERRLYSHYGIAWDDAWKAANQPGEGGWAHRDSGSAGTSGTGKAGAAGAAGAAGVAGAATAKPGTGRTPTGGTGGTSTSSTSTSGTSTSGTRPATATGTGTTGLAGTGLAATGGATAGAAASGGALGGRSKATSGATGARAGGRTDARAAQDEAMTRSEERMHVGVERYETGHARLRKYVVTEEERQTVPVRHEEVHVEREPITEANRGAAMSGEAISEAEYDVVLHGERPVVRTEAVPVERVRLVTEEHVEQRTVTGEVRKERIEAELPGEKKSRPVTGQDRGDSAAAAG